MESIPILRKGGVFEAEIILDFAISKRHITDFVYKILNGIFILGHIRENNTLFEINTTNWPPCVVSLVASFMP